MGPDFDLTKYCKYFIEESNGVNVLTYSNNWQTNNLNIYQTEFKEEKDLLK
jgi:hypothetical protein